MKKKIYKLMGVALVVVLLASLTVGLAAPTAADPGKLKWTNVTLPKVEDWSNEATFAESEGDFWATPGIDVGPIAVSPDGDTLFAAVADGDYLGSDWFEVLKSTDGGYSWTVTGLFDDFDISDPIVDIVVSPDYDEDTTVVVATTDYVYQSVDGGKKFAKMDDPWDTEITDLDVALDDRGRLAIMVGTAYGSWDDTDVWVLSTTTGMTWQAQQINLDIDNDQDDDDFDGDINYHVLACAFSPGFADDEGIVAVVTGDDPDLGEWVTRVRFAFAYMGETNPGPGWGADIMDAHIKDALGGNFGSWQASIAFPDDFDPWGVGSNVCFVGIYSYDGYWGAFDEADVFYDPEETGADGDAYKIVCKESGLSSAVDLDVRGVITTLLPTVTEITSIDVCGNAEDATILVGTDRTDLTATPEQFLVYYSTDSGETWDAAAKAPTGGAEYWGYAPGWGYFFAMPRVLMAPDFCESGIAYASTWGYQTDAFQRTSDGGDSWNQISIIDYGMMDVEDTTDVVGYNVADFDAAGYNAADILRMTTQCPIGWNAGDEYYNVYFGAIWERTGGKHWERIFSYANPAITDNLKELRIKGDAFFAIDFGDPDPTVTGDSGFIWRSSDNGATWPKKITTKPDVSEVMPISETTIYTGHFNGEVWWSTKSGVGWTKPDDSEIPSNTSIADMSIRGDIVLIGSSDGSLYISSDGGETIERVGMEGPSPINFGPFGPPALESFDLGFDANNIIYATQVAIPNIGVWRCEVDLDDPHASEWDQIDDIAQPDEYDPEVFAAWGPFITLPPNGVGYVIDNSDPADDGGGLWRCTNPTADIDGAHPPYFERENKGLEDGDGLKLNDLDLAAPPALSPTFFCTNANAAEYWEQVVMFTDTLNFGVTLAMPAEDATGVGLLPAGYVYPTVTLAWESMAGATSYQYQVAIDSDFKTLIPPGCGFTTSLAAGSIELDPNMTYYWRVRVAKEGSLLGAPLISPWSATWKFKTAIGATMARPDLEAPWSGEPDVPLDPTFEWSGIEWAEVYEYELAADPATTAGGYFTAPLKALIGTDALVSTAWKCDIALDYETRYYWHVKAFGVDTETPWSDVGTFTTMSVPPEPVEPGPPIVVPPQEVITPAWIWAIVIIGAILVIAVIVLIVTTRRVP